MMYDYKHNKANFVYDILFDRLSDLEIAKGIMYWYFLKGRTLANLQDDMIYRSNEFYTAEEIIKVIGVVTNACKLFTDTK